MQIILVGVDHLSAPIALRERLSCTQRQIPQVLYEIRNVAQECVLLSTCNRIEIYAVFSEIEEEEGYIQLLRILSNVSGITLPELKAHSYLFVDEQVVSHLYGVACGLFPWCPESRRYKGR